MQCRRYQPTADLMPWLAYGWEWHLDKRQLMPDIFPGTGAEILFNMGETLTITSHSQQGVSRSFSINAGATVLLCPRYSRLSFTHCGHIHLFSLRLRSAACFELFGVPLEHVCDQVLPLNELGLTSPTAELVSEQGPRVVGHWVRQQLSLHPHREPNVVQAIEQLYYGIPATELQQQLGISTRTFQRRLRCYVGTDARYFQRTARFQRTLRKLLAGVPLQDTLLEGGYCDQSHFIKNCQFFTQRSPGHLLTPEHKILNHYSPQINRLVGFL